MSDTKQRSSSSTRRNLLKAAAGCGMMTNTSLLGTLLNLQATKALAANHTSGYKALVCLFFYGGNDSYNMLMPLDGNNTSGEYGDYYSARSGYDDGTNNPGGLALEQSTLLPITGPNGRSFGVHPGMSGIQDLYNSGNADAKFNNKVAFVANVGSLIGPTTRTDYNNRANLPLGLFSHADLTRHWMTGVPQTRSQVTGWGGRMADLLTSTNLNGTVSMNISTNGVNLFQAGNNVVPYTIGTGGATVVSNYFADLNQTGNLQNRIFSRNTDSILGQTYGNLLAQSVAGMNRDSIDAAIDFNSAINAVTLNTAFDNESLSNRFKVIARVIGAQATLQQSRQVFFVAIGGFDNHSGLIGAQNVSLPKVSRALRSFYDATVELGVENDVTTFSASEFSRTLGTNGQGSDHAWGANHIVMGGSVDGGKIYGDYPTSLVSPTDPFAGSLNVGRGRFIPTTSVDEFAAELAMWFGVSNNQDMETMLPNIRSFVAGGAAPPLGMFV